MATPPPLGQYSTTPVFNTKAVARETEVPADTFRAWERRYGIPLPQRTAGGHRLYSERDIAIIRWLRDRTAEGMNISQAVLLLNSALADADAVAAVHAPYITSVEPRTLQRINEEFLGGLIMFDSARADRLLSEAFSLYAVEDVLLNVVQPTLVEIGDRWHRGEINVAIEHFATQFVRRKLAGMLNVFDSIQDGRGTIIMACAPNELHDMGMLFGALFLVRRGWHAIYLGSQVPLVDLLSSIHALKPDLVCLSASMPDTARALAEVAKAIIQQFPQMLIGYGGRVFNIYPQLREMMPGTYLGQDARELTAAVATLLTGSATSATEL